MSKLLGCACAFKELERVPRTFWMRWIPFVRLYHCRQCNQQFLASKRKVDAARRPTVFYVPNSAANSTTAPVGVTDRTSPAEAPRDETRDRRPIAH